MKSYETVAGDLEELLRRRAGRKRTAKITLPALGSMDTDEKNIRLAKVRIAEQGDPLGLTTGRYAQRPRYTVGEATPERMRHAREAGAWLQTESERNKRGDPTGLQRKRFKPQLEVWFERGAIDRPSLLAAQAYQRDHDLSISAGGQMIAKYGPQMPPSVRELLPAEIRMEYQTQKAYAQRAVPEHLWPVLDWIALVSNDDIPPDNYAALYWPHLSRDVRLTKFRAHVESVCASLNKHYGLKERHRWAELRQTAQELCEMMVA
jgi:hypothetical protein